MDGIILPCNLLCLQKQELAHSLMTYLHRDADCLLAHHGFVTVPEENWRDSRLMGPKPQCCRGNCPPDTLDLSLMGFSTSRPSVSSSEGELAAGRSFAELREALSSSDKDSRPCASKKRPSRSELLADYSQATSNQECAEWDGGLNTAATSTDPCLTTHLSCSEGDVIAH